MKKFFKSVFFRICVIVGVCFVFSLINSCNVKAFTSSSSINDYNYYINNSDYTYLTTNTYLFGGNTRINYYFYDTNNNLTVALSSGSFNNITDNRLSQDKNFIIVKNMQDDYQNGLIFINEPEKLYFQNNTLKYVASSGNYYFSALKAYTINQGNAYILYPSVWTGNGSYVYNYVFNNNYTSNDIVFSTFDILDNNGNVIHSSDLAPAIPEIVSLNANVKTTNNVVTGYSFQPEFTVFDTTLYDYQYTYNDNYYLNLIENEQLININANGLLYLRIKEKSTSDIIDSASFYIKNVGNFYNSDINYKINFTGEYRTINFNNDNISQSSMSEIENYNIYVDFIPNSSILKYQVQYVNEGDTLTNNWTTLTRLNDTDFGDYTYIAFENGVLYARILDKNDNVLVTNTFTVNSIGLMALDNVNDTEASNFYDSLRSKVNFGGPIGSLINIPVTLLQTISRGFSGATGVCEDYQLGSLWGHNLKLPCVNIRSYLGSTLYNLIDVICACCMLYMIFKMLLNAYYDFISMEKNPVDTGDDVNVRFKY